MLLRPIAGFKGPTCREEKERGGEPKEEKVMGGDGRGGEVSGYSDSPRCRGPRIFSLCSSQLSPKDHWMLVT